MMLSLPDTFMAFEVSPSLLAQTKFDSKIDFFQAFPDSFLWVEHCDLLK